MAESRTPPPPADDDAGGQWCLEAVSDAGGVHRVPIDALPFRIGRRGGLELTIASPSVSKEHAEIVVEGGALVVRDLGSTNGTFVNRRRVRTARLHEGDVLHFAKFEYRLGRVSPEDEDAEDPWSEDAQTKVLDKSELPSQLAAGTAELGELLRKGAVRPVFQPIVRLPDGELVAYEALGRGTHPALPERPSELFAIAARVGAEAELSELFRHKVLEVIARRPDLPPVFLNTHPAELRRPDLVASLERFVRSVPSPSLVIETHERVLEGSDGLRRLRAELDRLGIGLAFDDFAAGEARFVELGEVPPDYLKFDIRFVRDIDRAPPSKIRLLTSFITAARDLGIQTVAEGIETEAEAATCARVGFDLAQGHFFGRPVAVE